MRKLSEVKQCWLEEEGMRPEGWPKSWPFPCSALPPGWPIRMGEKVDLILDVPTAVTEDAPAYVCVCCHDKYMESTDELEGQIIRMRCYADSKNLRIKVDENGVWSNELMFKVKEFNGGDWGCEAKVWIDLERCPGDHCTIYAELAHAERPQVKMGEMRVV